MIASLSHRPPLRAAALAAAYLAILLGSLVLSLLLRFDFNVPRSYWSDLASSALWILPLKVCLLAIFGQFRSLLTFFGLPDAMRLAWAMGLAGLVETLVWFAAGGQGVVPRGVIVTDIVVSFCGLIFLRAGMKAYREWSVHMPEAGPRKRTIVAGAGSAGASLAKEVANRRGLGLEIVAFLEDDPGKIGGTLHGMPVLGPASKLAEITRRLELEKIVIAMPTASPTKIKSLVLAANELHLEHDILPSVGQLLSRRVTVQHLRPVEPEDLLGRKPAELDNDGITMMLTGKTVLVTGAGGSIGAELCRQIAAKRPSKLVLVDRSEPALFAVREELDQLHKSGSLVSLALDVCHEPSAEKCFAAHRPAVVFHAAAHKHVPLMEDQPAECFKNNVLGTCVVADLAGRYGTNRFVLISTDKAVNPAGVMGATKQLAESAMRTIAARQEKCLFASVRFGNVLGSSGSVVPIFRRQIAAGGPVTVTDPEATRFFMTVPEAAGLILQSALLAEGGDTFMLEMGRPVKIDDLARQMIEIAGFSPGSDIEIVYTGLRPGEKLHEEATATGESFLPTQHPLIRRAGEDGWRPFDVDSAAQLLSELMELDPQAARERVIALSRQSAPSLRFVAAA